MKKLALLFLLFFSCTKIFPSNQHQNTTGWSPVKLSIHCITFTPQLGDVKYAPQVPLSSSFHEIVKHPPQWMLDQINHELAYYKTNGTLPIEDMFNNTQQFPSNWKALLLYRYKIINGRIYVKDYTCKNSKYCTAQIKYIDAALMRLHLTAPLPNGLEFVISAHDGLSLVNISTPIFSFGKHKGNHFIVTIPDWEMLSDYESRFNPQIETAIKKFPWEEKEDIAFWRGSTTGGNYSLPSWRDFPRVKLVYLSKNHDCIDAKFTNYPQGAASNKELLSDKSILGEFISPEDSLQYRYLIDIDGNACTWSRLYWILRSNCVPFKQQSQNTMWYHRALKPFVHFVPYANDLSDLSEMIQWAQFHPEDCKKIAEKSRKFVLKELTTEHAYAYLYLLLKEYSQLFD